MSKDQHNRTRQTKNAEAGDTEKNVTHMHHAGIAEHPVESLLRDCYQSDIDDVTQ